MLRLLIHGIGGKMGRVLMDTVDKSEGFQVVAGVDRLADSLLLSVPVFKSLPEADVEADVLVDFSRPEALGEILSFASGRGMAVVLATTGYSSADIGRMERAAQRIPIFRSANMSLGINLLIDLAEKCATFLGDGCDVEIIEAHHRHKADAPSGTALMVADALNEVYVGEKEYTYGRHTRSTKRAPSEIGIHAVRGGSTVGDHSVLFLMDDEVVEVAHRAQSRGIFALGALRAAQFVAAKEPKLYGMRDLLLDKSAVTHVHAERHVAMITLTGLPETPDSMAAAFACMAEARVNLDMISQTPQGAGALGVSFSLPEQAGHGAAQSLRALFGKACVHLDTPLVKLTVEGLGMERQSGIAAHVFKLMHDLAILPRMVTTSPTEISMLIATQDEFRLTDALVKAFDI